MTALRRKESPAQIASKLEKMAVKRAQERTAQKDPQNWGVNVQATALPGNADLEGRNVGKVFFSHRTSWIDRLLVKGSPEQISANRLSELIATRKGEGDRPDRGTSGTGSRDLVTDKMMKAGDEIDRVLNNVGLKDRKLLVELIDPTVIHTTAAQQWAITVGILTGEKHRNGQAAVVRNACQNLAEAFKFVDHNFRG